MRPRPSKSLDLGLKFRGFLRSRLAFSQISRVFEADGGLKVQGFLEGVPRKTLKNQSEVEVMNVEDF